MLTDKIPISQDGFSTGGFFHLYKDVEVHIAKTETLVTQEAPAKLYHTNKSKKPSGKLLSYTA